MREKIAMSDEQITEARLAAEPSAIVPYSGPKDLVLVSPARAALGPGPRPRLSDGEVVATSLSSLPDRAKPQHDIGTKK